MKSKASAVWQGGLKDGNGRFASSSGALANLPYSFKTRFEGEAGTNPEELIGAAHAGCFSMFLSALLSKDGFNPVSVHTTATVHLAAGPTINKIELVCRAEVPGIDADQLADYAAKAKSGCPVSKALAAVDEITLDVALV